MQGTYMGATYKAAMQCMVQMFEVKQLRLKILSQKWVAICMYMYEIGLFAKFIASSRVLPQK